MIKVLRADIYTHVNDPKQFLGRFLWQKIIVPRKKALLVYDPMTQSAQEISYSLWAFQDTAFIPHCLGSTHPHKDDIPVWMISRDECQNIITKKNVLINISENAIPEKDLLHCTQRLVEIIGNHSQAIHNARERFRTYRHYSSLELYHHAVP
jgi:DNA polymerase IIIc chi subunit